MTLDNKIKELIAVGASISANCQPCLQYHLSKAIEHGADEPEIKEAIEAGKLVRRGAAAKMDKFALTQTTVTSPPLKLTNAECGCEK